MTTPDVLPLTEVAEALDVSVDWLLGRVGSDETPMRASDRERIGDLAHEFLNFVLAEARGSLELIASTLGGRLAERPWLTAHRAHGAVYPDGSVVLGTRFLPIPLGQDFDPAEARRLYVLEIEPIALLTRVRDDIVKDIERRDALDRETTRETIRDKVQTLTEIMPELIASENWNPGNATNELELLSELLQIALDPLAEEGPSRARSPDLLLARLQAYWDAKARGEVESYLLPIVEPGPRQYGPEKGRESYLTATRPDKTLQNSEAPEP